jgi:hypothetical protein
MWSATRIPISCFFALCFSAYGGVVTTSVTCGTTNNATTPDQTETETSTSSCGISIDPPGGILLTSTGTVSAGANFVSLQGEMTAPEIVVNGFDESDEASLQESASYQATILTDGPVQDGFMVVNFQACCSASPSGPGAEIDVNLGPYSDSIGVDGCAPGLPCDGTAVIIPVTLGVPLALSMVGTVTGGPIDDEDGFFGVNLSATMTFSFLEEDGTTPVDWTDPPAGPDSDLDPTPEPKTVWLSAFGIALIGIAIRKKSTRKV